MILLRKDKRNFGQRRKNKRNKFIIHFLRQQGEGNEITNNLILQQVVLGLVTQSRWWPRGIAYQINQLFNYKITN